MDIALLFRNSNLFDLAVAGYDLQRGHDLESAIYISIFTDRRADNDDKPYLADRKGWWGDTYLPNEYDKIGSRLWLLQPEKQTQQTLNDAREYIQECLQWLIDDNVALSINVENEWIRKTVMGISIDITKPDGTVEKFNYEYAWDQLNAI